MLMEVKKGLRLMGLYCSFNLSAAMEYRMSFLIQVIGMALNNTAFIFFWWILFHNVPVIGGYGFSEVMLLWALASTSFGVAHVFFGNTRHITQIIMTGELDAYLLQPSDVLIKLVCSKTSLSAWGDMLYGLVLMSVMTGFSMSKMLLFLLFSLTGGLLMAAVSVSFHTLSFYAGNLESFANLMTEFMLTFSIYPEGIFGDPLKGLIYLVVPIGFMAYVPARIIQTLQLQMLPLVLLVVLAWIVLAYTLFYKGLRRYESGNLMVNKL